MSLISIRLPEALCEETRYRAKKLALTYTAYIRQAIEQMNEKIAKDTRKKQLITASFKVRKQSMLVNAEFAKIEHDPEN